MSGKEYGEALAHHKQTGKKKAENILHLHRKNKHWREIQFIKMYQCSSNCFDTTSSISTEQWPFTPALLWAVHHWPTLGTQTHLPLEAEENTGPGCAQIHKATTSVCARHPQHINISPAPLFLCWLTGSWDCFLPLLWGSPALKCATQFNSTASYFPRLGLSSKSELMSKCGFRKCFIENDL